MRVRSRAWINLHSRVAHAGQSRQARDSEAGWAQALRRAAHTVLGATSGTDARVCRVPPRGRPARAHTGAATTAVSFPSAVAATKIDAVAGDDDLGHFSSNPTTGSLRPPTRCIGWPWNGPNQLRPRRPKAPPKRAIETPDYCNTPQSKAKTTCFFVVPVQTLFQSFARDLDLPRDERPTNIRYSVVEFTGLVQVQMSPQWRTLRRHSNRRLDVQHCTVLQY